MHSTPPLDGGARIVVVNRLLAAVALVVVVGACAPLKTTAPTKHPERVDAETGIAEAQAILGGWTRQTPATAINIAAHGAAYLLPGFGIDLILVYFNDTDRSVFVYRWMTLHEYGHVNSEKVMAPDSRSRVQQIMGWNEWREEAFADVFAFAASGTFATAYDTPEPTSSQISQLRQAGLVP